MNEHTLLEETRARACDVLHRCVTPAGFRASALTAGYPQIWARDSIITLLGAAAAGDATLLAAGRASLQTMRAHQSRLGMIQLNVNPDTGYVSTENAGAVDANLWFIIGHYLYHELSGDDAFVVDSWPAIDHALLWLEHQDMNACGLLEVPEAGNWMDLLAVSYNTLYDNVLYYAAALAHEELARLLPPATPRHSLLVDAAGIHQRLNLLMWVDRCWVAEHFAQHLERLQAMRLEWYLLYHNIGTISSRPYYLPWVAFREYGDWCDGLANVLAILAGIADGHRAEHILRFMHQVGMAEPYPTKAIYPPIYPGERHWREYYRSRNLNVPNQYHNGGIWPMIGGFHVAALVRRGWESEARDVLVRLATACRHGINGAWEFNEWLHGTSGHPMGFAGQAWSAAMFLYADAAVQSGKLPLWDALLHAKPALAAMGDVDELVIRPAGGPV